MEVVTCQRTNVCFYLDNLPKMKQHFIVQFDDKSFEFEVANPYEAIYINKCVKVFAFV